jgi:hypothetical protein
MKVPPTSLNPAFPRRMQPQSKAKMAKDAQMSASKNDESVVNEEVWRAWIQKGRLHDQAAARRGRILGSIALVILALGTMFYYLAA